MPSQFSFHQQQKSLTILSFCVWIRQYCALSSINQHVVLVVWVRSFHLVGLEASHLCFSDGATMTLTHLHLIVFWITRKQSHSEAISLQQLLSGRLFLVVAQCSQNKTPARTAKYFVAYATKLVSL
jgi:hypothetical protein